MDLSKLSNEDLLALEKGGLQAISNEGLQNLYQSTQPKSEQPMSWGEAGLSGLKRFPASTANVIGGIAETVLHPIDTATSLKDIAVGALSSDATPEQKDLAHNVAEFYKDRYGSTEGFKKAIATDPAGVLSDVSTVLTGGGALASKVPALAKVGQAVSKAGSFVDPLSAATKTVGLVSKANIPSSLVGMTTGTGSDVMRTLYEAGKEGGPKLAAALRNMRTPQGNYKDLVTDAREALTNLQRQRSAEYNAGMEGVRNDLTTLSIDPIEQSIKATIEKHQFKGRPSGKESAKTQGEILQKIDEWKALEPSEFHTAEGLDWLKREIGDIGESTEYGSSARKVADESYNAVKKEITKQAPEYADVMRKYSDASDLLHELTGTFSLGEKARTDTAVRKLQQALRNNQNTNFGYRSELINELENAGATNLRPRVAGQVASTWTPRGLQGASAATIAAMATQNPALALSLPLQSPRLMGEAAVLAGKGARLGKNLLPDNIDPKILANYLYQAQQPKGE